MNTTPRTIAVRIAAAAVAVAVLLPIGREPAAGAAEEISVVGAGAEESALVEWAVARYDAAGIEIRPVTVVFHSREAGHEPCKGAVAYYRSATRTVDMCNATRPDHERRHWILHELGHAHTFDTLDPGAAARFTEASHADSWNDHADRWQNRGQERAADIVAWGLNPDPEPIYWMQDLSCEVRAGLFHDLTGLEIAHDEC